MSVIFVFSFCLMRRGWGWWKVCCLSVIFGEFSGDNGNMVLNGVGEDLGC